MAKRRGNHEGSITQLNDGRWQGRVSMPNGKRQPVYGKTYAECCQKLNILKRQLEDNHQHDRKAVPGEMAGA